MPTRILLIDEDQVDRTAVRRALAKSGLAHELTEASDGTTGLRIAEERAFDCVLLDYRLPDVDTFELLASLLSQAGGNQAIKQAVQGDGVHRRARLRQLICHFCVRRRPAGGGTIEQLGHAQHGARAAQTGLVQALAEGGGIQVGHGLQ